MRGPLSSCVVEHVLSASTVVLRLLGGEAGGDLGCRMSVFLSTAPLASEDAMSLMRWLLTAAEMTSLTGGSSFFAVVELSFFTFGTGFISGLGLKRVFLRVGGWSSLGSGAFAGANLR